LHNARFQNRNFICDKKQEVQELYNVDNSLWNAECCRWHIPWKDLEWSGFILHIGVMYVVRAEVMIRLGLP